MCWVRLMRFFRHDKPDPESDDTRADKDDMKLSQDEIARRLRRLEMEAEVKGHRRVVDYPEGRYVDRG